MNLEKINELTAQDMAGVNAAILEQLNSDVQLINQLGYYIVSGGGKRIRPMIAVLAARAVGYEEMRMSPLLPDRVYPHGDSAARRRCG
ncbi:octaprenyl-diphosphate synthase [Escherichia coli]|nr:octaprenyl-diphosphate synthase [Escherichia coli]